MFYSPLRYPGGKSKLYPFIKTIIEWCDLKHGVYIEPFAGGAEVAFKLLMNGDVERIVLNDSDRCIYAFWKSVFRDTYALCCAIANVPITIDEWNHQRYIYLNHEDYSDLEVGFATFFLNRTNRSGIVKGGIIGGQKQDGAYKINSRFNKKALINRIETISKKKAYVGLYNYDINDFINQCLPIYNYNIPMGSLIYLDPPYYKKGKQLYTQYMDIEEHKKLERTLSTLKTHWVLSYDLVPETIDLYKNYETYTYNMSYSVATHRKDSELMVFGSSNTVPSFDFMHKRDTKIEINKVNIAN